ncbi:HAD family hydrolase [Macrococcus sp. EM39E]|uniref:HAD family hydrolase n=1 Tax=Macrococcus animalis TaxID=3395467 RepID=UPI0039BEB9C8
MSKYKLVLFDKDGTLLKFDAVWLEIGYEITEKFIHTFAADIKQEELLALLGVKDNKIHAEGILSSGTTNDIIRVFKQYTNQDIAEWTRINMDTLGQAYEDKFQIIEGTQATLNAIKMAGYKLAIVTADDRLSTVSFLEKFNILKLFDDIITSDIAEYQKPNEKILNNIIEKYNLSTKELIMVGDTPIDMQLAKNADLGLSIGVLSGTSKVSDLYNADIILEDISKIIQNGRLIWEDDINA